MDHVLFDQMVLWIRYHVVLADKNDNDVNEINTFEWRTLCILILFLEVVLCKCTCTICYNISRYVNTLQTVVLFTQGIN